jgi:hypothetical protein
MTSITVRAPRQVAVPRGATLGAWAFRQVSLVIAQLADASRARAEQRRQAARAEEANQVRTHARSVAGTDPGFAADLYAAADRHETAD